MSEDFLKNSFQEFTRHLQTEKNISRYTVENYNSDLYIFYNYLVNYNIELDVKLINKHILKQYFQFLKFDKEYATSTMRRKIHCLSSYFKFLYEEDYISDNPMKSIHAPKRPQAIPIFVTREDMLKLIKQTDISGGEYTIRDKTFFLLLFLTGLRRGELSNLRWNNVDFNNKNIRLLNTKGRSSRVVPLVEPLLSYLKMYKKFRNADINDYVIVSESGNRMSETSVEVLFRKYVKLCELDGKGYTPHKCRHTFATNMAKGGLNTIELADLLGHKDLNTTRIYTHMNTADIGIK